MPSLPPLVPRGRYLTVTSVGVASLSLCFLWLLPDQKGHVAELAARPKSPRAGAVMVALLVVLIVVGTSAAVLPILPATACLRLAGGTGCGGGEWL